jgi:hypothetical protein
MTMWTVIVDTAELGSGTVLAFTCATTEGEAPPEPKKGDQCALLMPNNSRHQGFIENDGDLLLLAVKRQWILRRAVEADEVPVLNTTLPVDYFIIEGQRPFIPD